MQMKGTQCFDGPMDQATHWITEITIKIVWKLSFYSLFSESETLIAEIFLPNPLNRFWLRMVIKSICI